MSSASHTALGIVDLLRDVRDGVAADPDAIAALVRGAADGSVPDYQLSAFCMAVYLRGLPDAATATLTLAMRDSGQSIDLTNVPGRKVDKHSTGGVGDKISLHLAPWLAACGVPVPMVAGRGLGHTGGTLDKLDAIPGFSHALTIADFRRHVAAHQVAIMGQSQAFAPADKTLYALRDVTATVESVPLITASILAKKLAEGIDGLVLDVKVGSGAFMKDLAGARALAQSIIRVGAHAGLQVRAVLSQMHAPLGRTIGNALEVRESIACLQGGGPPDTLALSLALGTEMLLLAEVARTRPEAMRLLLAARDTGRAWQSFRTMVAAQGGDVDALDDGGAGLPVAPERTPIAATGDGYVAALDAYKLGHASVALGAGRARAEDDIDPAVGIVIDAPVGHPVRQGQPVLTVHHRGSLPPSCRDELMAAIGLAAAPPPVAPIVIETLGGPPLAGA